MDVTNKEEREKEERRAYYADEGCVPVTWRQARKAYKICLVETHAKFEKDRGTKKSFDNEQQDCLRCLLISQGNIMISDSIVSTCKVAIPEGITMIPEYKITRAKEKEDEKGPSMQEDLSTLAITTSLGASLNTRVNLSNSAPLTLVKNRSLDKKVEVKISPHECVKTIKIVGTQPASIDLQAVAKDNKAQTPMHVVIYAVPGFGKTTFQKNLARRGVYILDTDDIPSIGISQMTQLLEWTSILTNRLDLLNPTLPTIVFIPKESLILQHRIEPYMRLNEEDADYWIRCLKLPHHMHIVKCIVENTYMSDWFEYRGIKGQKLKEMDENFLAKFFLASQL